MIRRLFVRLIRGCIALGVLLLMATALIAFLAFRQPAFYAELRAQAFSPADQAAATQHFDALRLAVSRWLDQSIAQQQAQQTATAAAPIPEPYDPSQDAFVVHLTQQQLNALLAAEDLQLQKPLQHPRVAIDENTIQLGVEAAEPSASAVLSVELEPTWAKGDLRLDIRAARVGSLTLPLQTILSCLPRAVTHSDGNVELDLTLPSPHLTLKLPRSSRREPVIKSIRCAPGEVIVELLPPTIDRPSIDGRQNELLSDLN